MQEAIARRESSRAPAARFRPRINLRSADSLEDFRQHGPLVVVRYGVMPDGSEVPLGRTVDWNLDQSTDRYWEDLFQAGFLPWLPRLFRPLVKKLWAVEVKGYDMTPLPPLGGAD